MAATDLLYALSAAGAGMGGAPSYWTNAGGAIREPNGLFAVNTWKNVKRGATHQQLTLTGYDPQAAILAATGGVIPYSLDFLHVQVTFTLTDASNFSSVDVLLLDADGNQLATAPLYLLDTAAGITTLGWVNYIGHNGLDDGQPLTWDDLAGCQIVLDVDWSPAAQIGATFAVDAVGMFVSYTVDPPTTPLQPPTAVPVQAPGGGVTLRVYDRDDNRLGTLPWSKLSTTIVRNDLAALSAEVPKGLIATGLLDGERYLRVAVNGRETDDWFVLDDDGDDDANEYGAMRPVAIAGTGVGSILDWGVVYSWQYDPTKGTLLGLDPNNGFAGKTPGFVLRTLIDAAKARGCFPQLTYSFTDDVDSAGRAWPTIYSKTYDIGTSLLKVLTDAATDGWVDWEMTGFRLDCYVPDTTLALDRPDVILRLGKGVTQAPRKRTRKSTRTALLANGDQGATVEVDDPTAAVTYGRREGYEGRSGVTDVGTLTAATTVSLARQTDAHEALTLEIDPYAMPEEAPALPRPGGYIRYDQRRLSPTELEPMRVQSVAIDYGDAGKVSVELNDLWVDADIKRARQLDAILNGSTANDRVPQPQDAPDSLAPGPVLGLGLESTAYVAPDGTLGAQMTASWVQVTQNADGSTIDDLAGYELQWRQLDVMSGINTISINAITLYEWSPVVPGIEIDVRIRAIDRWGNGSTWSDWTSIMAGADVTPPPVPTAPVVDNYLGLYRAVWDGAFVGGLARPPDLHHVEVHLSQIDGFTPDARPIEDGGTLAGSVFAAGPVFRDTPYGQTWYAKLVAVDTVGNRSDPSDQSSGASGQVVEADVFDGAIGSSKLADLAVITAKIDDLAVNNAKIGSMEVGKLLAGTFTAQIIMGGTISTSADPTTSGGVQINGLGIYAWNSSGVQTVAIDTSGNATLTGTYRTAASGQRVEIGVAGATRQLVFYSPNGQQQYLRSETWQNQANSTVEALSIRAGTQALILATSDNTASMWGWSLGFIYRDDFSVWSAPSVLGDTANQRERVTINSNGEWTLWPGGGGTMHFLAQDVSTSSPRIQFVNPSGFGAVIKAVYANSVARIEVRDVNDQGFSNVYAAAFTVNSDLGAKTDVRAVDEADAAAMLTAVLDTKVHRYRRIRYDGSDAAEEIGLVAQRAPKQIVVGASNPDPGVDLYQMNTMLWGAVQTLGRRLAAIETRGGKKK